MAFSPAGSHLFVRFMAGGPSKLLDKEAGKSDRRIDIPPISSVGNWCAPRAANFCLKTKATSEPSAWYRYDPATGSG